MSQRNRRISARAAESLLSGAHADSSHPRLAATLRAAAGPTRPGELAGRQAAAAAFHRALQHPSAPRRRSLIRSATLRLTVKAAAVAAVVLGTGGVALAATGAIPSPLNNHHPVPSASTDTSHRGVLQASTHPGNADPSPSLVGLCHVFTAGAGSDHSKALENPAFRALITAAGGKDGVDAFCTKLLDESAPDHGAGNPTPAEHPSHPVHPSHPDHPADQPSVHPSS